MVHRLDPEEEALELIRDARLSAKKPLDLTSVTAGELHQSLFKIKNLREHLLKTASSPRRLGQLLGKLADRNDGTVDRVTIVQGTQCYTIHV
jgi:hypothetical protein